MANPFETYGHRTYRTEDKILFFKQLSVLLSSGISLMQSLELLSGNPRSSLYPICRLLSYSLQQGYTLATAMTLQQDFFSQLAITLTSAGEKSGQLPFVLAEIADYYRQAEALRTFVTKVTLYPAIVILLAIVVLGFFLIYILPSIAETVAALQGKPTPFLSKVLTVKVYLEKHFPSLMAAMTLCLSGLSYYREPLKRLLLRLPLINSLNYKIQEIRFCKLLALLLNSGFSITEAISISAATLEAPDSSSQLQYFQQKLSQGLEPSLAARCLPKLFSPLTIEFLGIGTAAGNLPQMLEEAASIQEQGLRRQLIKLKELIGPSLLILAALLTAAVICSALEPLFNLFTAIPEY